MRRLGWFLPSEQEKDQATNDNHQDATDEDQYRWHTVGAGWSDRLAKFVQGPCSFVKAQHSRVVFGAASCGGMANRQGLQHRYRSRHHQGGLAFLLSCRGVGAGCTWSQCGG